jgi:hypothetical protein
MKREAIVRFRHLIAPCFAGSLAPAFGTVACLRRGFDFGAATLMHRSSSCRSDAAATFRRRRPAPGPLVGGDYHVP